MKKALFILLTFLFFGRSFAQTELPNTISTTDKIYGLSKFWNEVNYNFVYLNKINKQQWESNYKTLIKDVQETKNDYEYYRLLQKYCATLKDGHTNVWAPKKIRSLILNGEFGNYRLSTKNIDGRAIITRVNLSKKKEIPIGSEIIEVNAIITKEYIDKYVKPYISTSTEHVLENQSFSQLLKAPIGTKYSLKIKNPKGKVFSLHLIVKKVLEKEVYPTLDKKKLMDFKWLGKKTAYISLNSFSDSKINSLFLEKLSEIKKAKKLIIDLRQNGGGNTNIGTEILKYLTNSNELKHSNSSSRLHIPTYKAWGLIYNLKPKDTLQGSKENRKLLNQVYLTTHDSYFHKFSPYKTQNNIPKSERTVIPTAILIGNYTASAAEDFLISANNQNHMIKIGEPTYGSTGQPMLFDLPGGGTGRICTKKDTYPNGREFVGYGIQPDVFVRKTYQDYLNDKDPVLQKAIEYLKKK